MAEETTTVKKVSRSKKVETETADTPAIPLSSIANTKPVPILGTFTNLINQIAVYQKEFDSLQKQIEETRIEWEKQQKEYRQELEQDTKQQQILRTREQEEYDYETKKQRKLNEDEFANKKAVWEKELQEQKDKIIAERKELEQLRKLVEGFEVEKAKAVKEAQEILRLQLNNQFGSDKKLSDQEFKAEKDILNLKLSNLTAENSRQFKEIEELKKALDETNKQVKEIAVKVIEASGNSVKNTQFASELNNR